MHKLKNRIINFRVTDEELALLKSASDLHGARCLSDFARSVMLGNTAEAPAKAEEQIEERIQHLDGRLTSVESDLTRVMDLLSVAEAGCARSPVNPDRNPQE